MATSAVTGSDLTNIRTGSQHIDDVALHITPLDSVQTGSVISVPTLQPYVSIGISWDGSHSDVSIGQMVKITNGSTLRAYAVVRKAPTASVLYISTTPLGGSGYATDIQSAIQVGDDVTVYTHRPLWGLYSRISNRQLYKMWDEVYTDENSQPPPVANAGAWQVAKIAVSGTATFTLPRSGSNTSFNFGSATTSSRLWDLPTGVTLVGGYALTDDVIEVDAVAGYHLVSYTHTDSNSKTHTAYVWLFVSDGSTGASLSERYAISINSDTENSQGRILSVTITGEDLGDVLYPSAGICLREWASFNNNSLSDGVLIDTFIGYVAELNIAHDGNIGTATFTVESPFIHAGRIPQPSQVIEEAASPTTWTQATSTLTNPRGLVYYAMKWHCPTMLDMHDLNAPYTTPRRKNAQWQAGSLQASMIAAAQYAASSIGSASDGTTVLRKNPMYMDNTDRNALANIITWQASDIQAPIEYINRFLLPFAEAKTGAFAYDGTSETAWLTQKRWNQGVGDATLPNFTVDVSDGLARVKEVVGHYYAEQTRPIVEIPITLTMNQDIISPAYWLWCSLTIPSEFDTYGSGFSSQRCLVTNIEREWVDDQYGITKTIRLSLQPETFGQPGEEIIIANAKSYQSNGYSINTPSTFSPDQNDSAFGGVSLMLAHDSNGKIAATYNYDANSPDWSDITPFVNDESVNDFAIDYNSAYFANGNNASYALGLYVVTTSGTTLNVWYFPDILTSSTGSVIETETMNDSSCTTEARIEVSETTPTLVIVAWHDQTGIEYIRSTDGGSNWTPKSNIGSAITDTTNDNAALGLDIDGVNQLISAPNGSSDYGLYRATTAAGSFSRLTNTEESPKPLPMVKIIPDTDDCYIAQSDGDAVVSNTHTVDFDGGDAYTINGIGVTPSVGAGGNTGNCVQFNSSISNNEVIYAEIDFGSDVDITNITFDVYGANVNSSRGYIVLDGGANYMAGLTPRLETGELNSWINSEDTARLAASDSITFPITGQVLRVGLRSSTTVASPDMRIDNIVVSYETSTGVKKLFKVSDFDGTDNWTDVSPASNEVPVRPYDLSIDLVDNDIVNTHIGSASKWYQSIDGTDNWTEKASSETHKRVFFSAGSAIAVAGTATILLSLDGTTFNDKTGNLASVWGSIGTIKRVHPL